jgi:hypothetical protein
VVDKNGNPETSEEWSRLVAGRGIFFMESFETCIKAVRNICGKLKTQFDDGREKTFDEQVMIVSRSRSGLRRARLKLDAAEDLLARYSSGREDDTSAMAVAVENGLDLTMPVRMNDMMNITEGFSLLAIKQERMKLDQLLHRLDYNTYCLLLIYALRRFDKIDT